MGFGSIVEEVEPKSHFEKKQEFIISKEELEAKSISRYHAALSYQKAGQIEEAIHEHLKLVSSCLIELDKDEDNFMFSSKLKYLCLKNIGELYLQISNKEMALKFFIEALQVDNSKIEMHSTVGKLAIDLKNYHLARHSYEMAFEINPENLFCAKKYVSILFIQENYELCLQILILLLEKNNQFQFGYVLLGEVLNKVSYLKVWLTTNQTKIYRLFLKNKIPSDKSKLILKQLYEERNEAVKYTKEKLNESLKSSKISFLKPFKLYSWKELGIQLIELHNHIFSSSQNNSEIEKPTILTQYIDFSDLPDEDVIDKESQKIEIDDKNVINDVSFTFIKNIPSELKLTNVESNLSNIIFNENDIHDHCQTENKEICEMITDENEMKPDTNIKSNESSDPNKTKISEEEMSNNGAGRSENQIKSTEASVNDILKDSRNPKSNKKSASEDVKKKRKCSFMMLDDDFKRRSKRVKNSLLTSLNPENELNSIMKLLPVCFQKDFSDLCKETQTISSNTISQVLTGSVNHSIDQENEEFFCENEAIKVKSFLKNMKDKKTNLVDLIMEYLNELECLYHLKWPTKLTSIYISCYECLRSHFSLNIHLSGKFPDEMRKQFVKICLIYLELITNEHFKKLSKKNIETKSSAIEEMSSRSDSGNTFFEDLNYLTKLSQNSSEDDFDNDFVIRMYWLNFLIFQDQIDDCLVYLQSLIHILQSTPDQILRFHNCSENKVISLNKATQIMVKLKKRFHIEDVFRIYNDGDYDEVIDILSEVLIFKEGSSMDLSVEENREQLCIMLNCYMAKKDHKMCMLWTIKSLSFYVTLLLDTELTSNQPQNDNTDQYNPLTFLYKIFNYIDVCMQSSKNILAEVSFEHLQLLIASICKLLEVIFEITTDSNGLISNIPCEKVIDLWMHLYSLLKWQYCNQAHADKMESTVEDVEDEDDEVPGFLKILIKGHDYLARCDEFSNTFGVYIYDLFFLMIIQFLNKDSIKIII